MNRQGSTKRIIVLSSRDTRFWHSPFSRELREMRRSKILRRCERLARRAGFSRYVVYDAFETVVASGDVKALS